MYVVSRILVVSRASVPAGTILAATILAATSVRAAHAQAPVPTHKLFFPACPGFDVSYEFDCYHNYDEVAAFLRTAADRYPNTRGWSRSAGRTRAATCG